MGNSHKPQFPAKICKVHWLFQKEINCPRRAKGQVSQNTGLFIYWVLLAMCVSRSTWRSTRRQTTGHTQELLECILGETKLCELTQLSRTQRHFKLETTKPHQIRTRYKSPLFTVCSIQVPQVTWAAVFWKMGCGAPSQYLSVCTPSHRCAMNGAGVWG